MPPKKTVQRNTHLLLFYLGFTRRTSLAFQSLNPSFESCAEGTCLADKLFQQLGIARSRGVIRVVK